MADASTAAIAFAIETEDGLDFLRHWNEGSFDICRGGWPDAPEDVYIGADPMHPETKKLMAVKVASDCKPVLGYITQNSADRIARHSFPDSGMISIQVYERPYKSYVVPLAGAHVLEPVDTSVPFALGPIPLIDELESRPVGVLELQSAIAQIYRVLMPQRHRG